MARRLFDERDEAERRRQEVARRHEAQLAEQAANNVPRGGVSSALIPDGVSPASAMLQAAKDGLPRRRSVIEEALDNDDGFTYHPIDREES